MINIFSKQNSNTIELLKWIAILTMIIDHLGVLFYNNLEILRIIGRVSLPLFGYLLIHNYIFFTSNKLNYIKRLFIFAIISQPFFWFIIGHKLNIFFLLSLSLLVIYISEKFEKMDRSKIEKFISIFIVVSISLVISLFSDYNIFGLLFLLSLYLVFHKTIYLPINIASTFFINIGSKVIIFSLFFYPIVYIAMLLKNIKIYRVNKWFFYSFYPAHLMILELIKIYS